MGNLVKLDNLDRKLLYYLDVNARMSNLQIAKKLRTSREVVDYRSKRLVKKGVIQRFFTHIQAQKLGYTVYKLYFKIKGLDENKEKEMIGYLVRHKNIYRVARCEGIYDFFISITSKDVYKLHEMLQDFYHKYDSNLLTKDVTISVAIYRSRNEYIIGKGKHEIEPLLYGGEKGNMVLDEKDTEILKILANNARIPIIKIAKKLGITSGAVMYRMKELAKAKIISAYRCSIDLEKIGYLYVRVFLSLHFNDRQKERELYQFCRQHANITLFLYCIGHWDFEVEFEIESSAAFQNLLREIKTRFSDIIKECEWVIISKEHKFDHFPECYPTNPEFF